MNPAKSGKDLHEDEDYGPREIGIMLGTCVGMYIANGILKEDLCTLVGDMYDGILKATKESTTK